MEWKLTGDYLLFRANTGQSYVLNSLMDKLYSIAV